MRYEIAIIFAAVSAVLGLFLFMIFAMKVKIEKELEYLDRLMDDLRRQREY